MTCLSKNIQNKCCQITIWNHISVNCWEQTMISQSLHSHSDWLKTFCIPLCKTTYTFHSTDCSIYLTWFIFSNQNQHLDSNFSLGPCHMLMLEENGVLLLKPSTLAYGWARRKWGSLDWWKFWTFLDRNFGFLIFSPYLRLLLAEMAGRHCLPTSLRIWKFNVYLLKCILVSVNINT